MDKVQRWGRLSSGGAKGGAPDLVTVEPSSSARKEERVDWWSGAVAENGVVCG
jgi:hypothetical protein